MAVFKQCKECGELFHGGLGFIRINGDIFCCPLHAEDATGVADGMEHWEELSDAPSDQPDVNDFNYLYKMADVFYYELRRLQVAQGANIQSEVRERMDGWRESR